MAIVDEDGERTRFPFLATVRLVVAGVVTVITVAVVVMVITVALRPENIRLSILQGYIEADTLWQQSSAQIAVQQPGDRLHHSSRATSCVASS